MSGCLWFNKKKKSRLRVLDQSNSSTPPCDTPEPKFVIVKVAQKIDSKELKKLIPPSYVAWRVESIPVDNFGL
jgi:hypothetical protein